MLKLVYDYINLLALCDLFTLISVPTIPLATRPIMPTMVKKQTQKPSTAGI